MSFTERGIEVTGQLTDVASTDQMIRSIEALKLLLKPASEIKTLGDSQKEEESLPNGPVTLVHSVVAIARNGWS